MVTEKEIRRSRLCPDGFLKKNKIFFKNPLTKLKVLVIICESHVDAGMAQSVEHVIGNDEVISSILITSSKSRGQPSSGFCFEFLKRIDRE